MNDLQTPKKRTPILITLLAIGIFLIGAVSIPLLVRGQAGALDGIGLVRPPAWLEQAAPQLALTDLEGNPINLDSMLGQVILVNNWATWCPTCKDEMPELQAYYDAHAGQGFTIIAIESGEPADMVSKFVRQLGLTFPVWLDPKGVAVDAFQNWDLPSSYVIDRHGHLAMSWTGPVNRQTLETYITPLLEE
jgi:cytochrome c biogenesis protein CcmG, thiol:disulfide interchange protein DsbE